MSCLGQIFIGFRSQCPCHKVIYSVTFDSHVFPSKLDFTHSQQKILKRWQEGREIGVDKLREGCCKSKQGGGEKENVKAEALCLSNRCVPGNIDF